MAGNKNDNHADKAARKAKEAATEAARSAREQVDEAIQHGAEAVDEARQRGAEALHSARQGAADMADMAANMRDEAGRLYRSGEKRIAGMADEAMHEAEAYYDEVSQMVRRQPATALGIAAGVGFLVGLLIARR